VEGERGKEKGKEREWGGEGPPLSQILGSAPASMHVWVPVALTFLP